MGIPTGLQYSITAIGSMVMQSANNGLGSVYVSAFTAAMRIKQFAMCPFDAVSTAASVFCSQNLGAKQPDRIRKGLRQAVTIGVAYGALIGLVLIFGGRTLTRIFCKQKRGGCVGCLCKISEIPGILLLESWYSQCKSYGDTGTWLFREEQYFPV